MERGNEGVCRRVASEEDASDAVSWEKRDGRHSHDLIWLDQIVLYRLLQTEACAHLVL